MILWSFKIKWKERLHKDMKLAGLRQPSLKLMRPSPRPSTTETATRRYRQVRLAIVSKRGRSCDD